MSHLLILSAALILAACSNDPVDKTPNGSPNNENNATNNGTSSENNGTNNATNSATNSATNNANVDPNNCTNNVTEPTCPQFWTRVETCPAGAVCEDLDSCGGSVICARQVDPMTYRDRVCAEDPNCDDTVSGCSVDEDCALVKGGDFCGCLECPASAIENVNQEAYLAYQQEARETCESLVQCGDAPCIEYLPHCNLQTSQCEGRESKYVTTEGLPDQCEVAADCAPVFEGEVCDACMCPNEAIPVDQVETYQSAFDVECAHGVACDCAPYEVRCAEGTCQLGSPG